MTDRSGRAFIDPLRDLGHSLTNVEKPARYLGGEYGSFPAISGEDSRLRIAFCFPDLYEIGMSNNAVRILYDGLGRLRDKVVCERVFAPAPDFEALLREKDVPLYTLESGIPLQDCDILAFSIGYELLATNVVTVLDSGHVPVRAVERGEGDPIVIAGGPAISNPLPYSLFLDAVYIGEAEAGFYELVSAVADLKAAGASRMELLARIRECPAIWMPARGDSGVKKAMRAIHSDFSRTAQSTFRPVAVLKTVQDHGTVEIMRGCPNGCRFCHAGYYYRPQRVKSAEAIDAEVEMLIREGGCREITLASLSSGDYPDIAGLIHRLNAKWSASGVSFQLPSLKVDSFTLPLLEELSEVRKSGLTFAVETPVEQWQGSINKIVSFDKTAAILKEAKARGFRQAKFYFMIGLPVSDRGPGEARAIVDFLARISSVERIALSVNVGTFVPKPHTPYQRDRQIGEAESLEAIGLLRDGLRPYRFIKLSFHSPFTSMLEGILARGDARVGELILEAWKRGARLDAWDEHFDRDRWRSVLEDSGWEPQKEALRERMPEEALPWDDIRISVSAGYLSRERERSESGELTGICTENCDHPCGSCTEEHEIVLNTAQHEEVLEKLPAALQISLPGTPAYDTQRFVLKFSKIGKAAYYPMHSVSGAFARALLMLDIPVKYSEGFNPLPKLELTPPLSLGAESLSEVLSLWLTRVLPQDELETLKAALNERLPQGLVITEIRFGNSRSSGKRSIGSIYSGSQYELKLQPAAAAGVIAHLETLGCVTTSSVAPSNDAQILSFYLDDAGGGDRNLMRLLETHISSRPVLEKCTLLRIESVGMEDGVRRPLFESL
ncbi:MAG: TIGR03960 family B12-binding radical SAM protein [Rectinemataceae bacterium]